LSRGEILQTDRATSLGNFARELESQARQLLAALTTPKPDRFM